MSSHIIRVCFAVLCGAVFITGCRTAPDVSTIEAGTQNETPAETTSDPETYTEPDVEGENTEAEEETVNIKQTALGQITDSDIYVSSRNGNDAYPILPADCSPDVVPPLLGTITFSRAIDKSWNYPEYEERPFWNAPVTQVIRTSAFWPVYDPVYERVTIARTLTPITALPEDADIYGITPTGHAYAFRYIPGEERDTYEGILQFDNENGIAITFYSYPFDVDFKETVLLPKMDSCRIWINGLGEQKVSTRIMDFNGAETTETEYAFILPLQADWYYNGSSVIDVWQNVYSGVFSTKRMELCTAVFDIPWFGYIPEDASEEDMAEAAARPHTEGTTKAGQKYIYYQQPTDTMDRMAAQWYFFSIQIAGMPEGNYIYISALTYDTDPAGYFEDVILPAIEGISFYNVELASEQAQP